MAQVSRLLGQVFVDHQRIVRRASSLIPDFLTSCDFTPHLASLTWSCLQPGSALPDVTLYEGSPDDKVTLTKLFQGKKGILFGVPGAYTPGCSKVNLIRACHVHQSRRRASLNVVHVATRKLTQLGVPADSLAWIHFRL